MNKEQEEKVIETFKWKLIYQENLDSMFLQAYDCMLYAEELQGNYFSLSVNYDHLHKQYGVLEKDCTDRLVQQHTIILEKDGIILREERRKRTWRGLAVGEGLLITGIILFLTL